VFLFFGLVVIVILNRKLIMRLSVFSVAAYGLHSSLVNFSLKILKPRPVYSKLIVEE